MPVINENDTTATDEISFGDNDFLAAQVAILVSADLLVLLTDIDGLHTADPRHDPDARLVREVTDFEALEGIEVGHTTSPLGSGGMRSKVVAADMATAAGIRPSSATVCARERSRRSSPGTWRAPTSPPRRASLVLQAVAALRQAEPRHDRRGCGGRSCPARGGDESAAGGNRGGARLLRRRGRGGDRRARCPPEGYGPRRWPRASAATPLQSSGASWASSRSAVQELLPRATEEAVHRDYMVLA